MRKITRTLAVSSVLLLCTSGAAESQVSYGLWCHSGLTACATIGTIGTVSKTVGSATLYGIRLQVEYTPPSDPNFTNSYLGKILLRFKGDVPNPVDVDVADGTRSWSIYQNADHLGLDWDVGIKKDGGAANAIARGELVYVDLFWDDSNFVPDINSLEFAAVHIQNLDALWCSEPGCDSQWAVVPEPVTMVLLGSGLVGVGGVAALRRRRRDRLLDSD
jgi:hypothetical protein